MFLLNLIPSQKCLYIAYFRVRSLQLFRYIILLVVQITAFMHNARIQLEKNLVVTLSKQHFEKSFFFSVALRPVSSLSLQQLENNGTNRAADWTKWRCPGNLNLHLLL